MGPNGVGKTTLFKMIIGEEKPDGGELSIGETVEISYVDQSRGGLDPKKTLWEVVSGGTRPHHRRQDRHQQPGLRRLVRLQGPRPAEAGRGAVRWRAQPAQPGPDPEDRRQRAAAGRADQRPRRRDAAFAGGRARGASRAAPWSSATTGGSSTRPPRTSSRGRAPKSEPGQVVLVRRRLLRLRAQQGRAARRGGGAAAPRHLPPARPATECAATGAGGAGLGSGAVPPVRRRAGPTVLRPRRAGAGRTHPVRRGSGLRPGHADPDACASGGRMPTSSASTARRT